MPPEAMSLVAQTFRVLGEPARLALLQRLQTGEASVSELATMLGTSQPNASKHLKTLQDAGLVTRRQEGTTAWFSIADPMVFELCELVCGRIQERIEERMQESRRILEAMKR